LGLFLNPWGSTARAIELREDALWPTGGHHTSVPLSELSSAPVVRRGLLSSTVTLPNTAGRSFTVRGVDHADADAFSETVYGAWTRYNLELLETEAPRINGLLSTLAELRNPTRYPSACRLTPILAKAKTLDATLLSKLLPEAIGEDQTRRIEPIREFAKSPKRVRDQAIAKFVETELAHWHDFFDNVESNPLTPEQRLSIVVDEDATLVLAGAGSGKTSVITAKAAYLMKAGIRKPEEILLLAFARGAAQEMSERIEERCGAPVEARTFHALAYDIIGAVEGSKPALAPHATDDVAFLALIKQILRDLVGALSEVSRAIIDWFAHFFVEPKSQWDFKTKHEYYNHIEKQDLRTLQGEQVKSYEELQIANWLYENGIAYEYEPRYEHRLKGTGRRDYSPDFRLTDSGIYIEHFGVRRKHMPDGTEHLMTAPYIDREEYLAGMEWKREVHASHGTVLIETFSYERQEGRLLTALTEKLAPHVTCNPRPLETIFDRVIELKQVDNFTRLLGTFLRKYKSGGYSIQDCENKAGTIKIGRRAKAFLAVFEPVYQEYQKQLGERIDFEDMILRAAHYAETGRYDSPFRHILVDEFQDISQSRARLIKALKAQHCDTRLFAVGDDWQSIFRFAGSDIHLMRDFGREFGGSFDGESAIHRAVDLGRTFRSVDQIAFAARRFVLKNPAQITKTVIPAGTAKEPAIRVVTTEYNGTEAKLREVLTKLAETADQVGQRSSVLLLGRYRFVQPENLSELKRKFPNLSISYKTIHASKGLEADHVILLNADSGRTGFPSEIADDPLLSLVSPEAEPFENAEERRVMYVAMTRARHTLTLLASASRTSAFVSELRAEPEYGIVSGTADDAEPHVCGECGGRLLPVPARNERIWYRCEHKQLCGNFVPTCSECEKGMPSRDSSDSDATCSCGKTFPACPTCSDGWLVERAGRYGRFLGCVRYPNCSGKAKLPNGKKSA
jgi:DNA helicase IV